MRYRHLFCGDLAFRARRTILECAEFDLPREIWNEQSGKGWLDRSMQVDGDIPSNRYLPTVGRGRTRDMAFGESPSRCYSACHSGPEV